MVGGVITNLIGQNFRQKFMEDMQEAQDAALQAQAHQFVLDHAPLPLKKYAKKGLMDMAEEHGVPEEQLPQIDALTTLSAMQPMIQQRLQQMAAIQQAQQQAPGADAAPGPATLADLNNLPARTQPFGLSLAALAGQAQQPAGPSVSVETPASTLAPSPEAAQAAAAPVYQQPLFEQPAFQQLQGTPPAAPTPSLRTLAAMPPEHLSFRQKLANALMGFGGGVTGHYAPQYMAQLQRQMNQRAMQDRQQQIVEGYQKGILTLPQAQEAIRNLATGISGDEAQKLDYYRQQLQIQEQERQKGITSDVESIEKDRDALKKAGLTDEDIELMKIERRMGRSVKPIAETANLPYTLTNQKGQQVVVMADRAGVVDIDPVVAERLGNPELAGKRVKVHEIPGWNLQGRTTTTAGKQTELDKLTSWFTASGEVTDPALARQKAGQLLLKKEQAKSGTADLIPDADLTALAQAAIAGVSSDPPFGLSANNPNRAKYFMIKSRLLRGMGVGEAAVMKADVKAGTQSIEDLTKTRGRLASFEETAKGNLQTFINTAQEVVDSGVPLINRPLREALKEAAGSPEIVAYEAARRVALNEIARIVNNPNLAGALSDSARAEVESISPENSTLNQIYAVVKILQSDMANRIQGMDDEIQRRRQGIREAIGGATGGQAGGTGGAKGDVTPAQKPDYIWNPKTQKLEKVGQ